jgi:ABC-type multidrug transport system fused ATPase/permease subunit
MKEVKKLFDLLDLKERKRAIILLFMILIMALLDMIGVASILPFVTMLSNPNFLETNNLLLSLFQAAGKIGITSKNHFLLIISGAVFILLIFSLSFKALTTYCQLRYVLMRECSISKKLLEIYLRQPYSWFLNRHSGDLGKNILSEVYTVVQSNMLSTINFFAHSLVAFFLIILLILVDPIVTLALGFFLVVTYGFIFKLSKTFLSEIGKKRIQANQNRFTIITEVFGYIKEVIVSAKEKSYIDQFSRPAFIYADSVAREQALRLVPKYLLEAIAFGSMILLVIILLKKESNFLLIIPTISFYAFAGYRLIPALQQIYASATQIRFTKMALDNLHRDFTILNKNKNLPNKKDIITFGRSLTLENVCYTYPGVSEPSLKNISLTIYPKSLIGIAGTTGSGKTTLVDVILGLLSAQKGIIKVDDKVINSNNHRNWQELLGYVPQQIFLTDDTIAANIAFGEGNSNIDYTLVEIAAKTSALHEFVINELPDGYETVVGEKGIRLSGGQRQRIGIARALYNKPRLLILDEATSALDNVTEKKVMDSIKKMQNDTTVILIAHRLSTLKNCNQIFFLEKGQINSKGTYEELFALNKIFKTNIETGI